MLPFFNRPQQVAQCLTHLIRQANSHTTFLLIDDGSRPRGAENPHLRKLLLLERVHLICHGENCGIAAARNSGLNWCRKKGFDLVIMIDSDCTPESNFIEEHVRLHLKHPEAICIGGTVRGSGKSVWARLDGLTSWVHCSPTSSASVFTGDEFRPVEPPYHLPTANFSVKLGRLPKRVFAFDERLKTGEDCLFVRELRERGERSGNKVVFYSSTPVVVHQDREELWSVVKRHYEWGHHQYFLQLGANFSRRCFHPLYRLVFALSFLPFLPVFALYATLINSRTIFDSEKDQIQYCPLIYLLWICKGVAIVEAAIRPWHCLRVPREKVQYEEVFFHTGDI